MKKELFSIVAFTLVISSCSSPSKETPSLPAESSSNIILTESVAKDTASAFMEGYFNTLLDSSSEVNSRDVSETEKILLSILGENNMKMLNESKDPFEALENLPEDKREDLLDYYSSVDPIYFYYDHSEMSTSETIILSITDLVSSNYLVNIPYDKENSSVSVETEEIVFVDSDEALVPFSAVSLIIGSTDYTEYLYSGVNSYHLYYIDGTWKISGNDAYSDYIESYYDANSAIID